LRKVVWISHDDSDDVNHPRGLSSRSCISSWYVHIRTKSKVSHIFHLHPRNRRLDLITVAHRQHQGTAGTKTPQNKKDDGTLEDEVNFHQTLHSKSIVLACGILLIYCHSWVVRESRLSQPPRTREVWIRSFGTLMTSRSEERIVLPVVTVM
jgi:hypothetical protein